MPNRTKEFERLNNRELYESLDYEPAAINLHLYQPPRLLKIKYQNRESKIFDITGTSENFRGFNHQILEESYRPLVEKRVLADENISWNLFGVTADWLEINYPEIIDKLRIQIEEGAKPPVGDTYLHIIFPFLSDEHKDMFLQISRKVYEQRWGVAPETVWLPESAADQSTLEALRRNDFLGVHLREHQIRSYGRSNLYGINTQNGKLLVIPGNNHLSGRIGFNKPWADKFYAEWSATASSYGYSPRLSIDGETLGHWWKQDGGVFEFANYLLRYLNEGYGWNNMDFDVHEIPDAELNENTSWSCMDSGLGRWMGSDDCSCELPYDFYQANIVRISKRNLFENISVASERIDESLNSLLPGWRNLYIDWFLRQRVNLATGSPIEADFFGDKQIEKLFLSAYIRDLGWTSCGWFFGDVGGFERQIPANSLKAIAKINNWTDILPDH